MQILHFLWKMRKLVARFDAEDLEQDRLSSFITGIAPPLRTYAHLVSSCLPMSWKPSANLLQNLAASKPHPPPRSQVQMHSDDPEEPSSSGGHVGNGSRDEAASTSGAALPLTLTMFQIARHNYPLLAV